MSYVRGLSCTRCEKEYSYRFVMNVCPECDGPLFIEFDIERTKENISTRKLRNRKPGVWKYLELLPNIEEHIRVSMGEGGTYLHKCDRLAKEIGLKELYLKDETSNPTGSFIDRGMTVEISAARKWNIRSVHNRSWHAGNMSASLVAYAARAGLRNKIFLGRRGNIDIGKFYQILAFAESIEIVRNREEATDKAAERSSGSHCVSSTNPHFLEGQKTIILEIYEQLDWTSPDWIVMPIGSGGTISVTWKGMQEIKSVGLSQESYPRIAGVQAKGCAPIINAFEKGLKEIVPIKRISTLALPIAMSDPLCGLNALDAINQTRGIGGTVTDNQILKAVLLLAKLEGVFAEPASAATIALLRKYVKSGKIQKDERVVCTITGMGLKYPDIAKTLVRGDKDLEQLLSRMEGQRVTTQLGRTKIQILQILLEGESYGYNIWLKLNDGGIRIKSPGVYQHLSDLVSSGLAVKTKTSHVLKRKRTYYGISEKGKWTITQLEKLG
ncbi:MAG: threonine synthase [Candidatus Thorarchaeota archaeon]